jgi:hypothetical protein
MIDFLIIGVPRSGSNHFCALLESDPRIVVHPEVLHTNGIHYKREHRARELLADVTMAERDADVPAFLRRLKAIEPEKLLGVKLFPGHGWNIRDQLMADHAIPKLVLYRQNLLAVYASNAIAVAANQFSTLYKPMPDIKVAFDAAAFEKHVADIRAWYAWAMGTLAGQGQRFFFVPYELLNEPTLIAGARQFITGAPDDGAGASPHVKSGQHDVLTRFADPDAVLDYLEANNLLAWRYDPGCG